MNNPTEKPVDEDVDLRFSSISTRIRYSTWNGRRYLNQYRMGRCIGKGSYSNVRIATDPNGKRVAIKYYFKSMCSSQRAAIFLPNDEVETISVLDKVHNEIELHGALRHPNIGEIIEVLDDTAQHVLYVVMEFFPVQCMTWDDMALAYTAASVWHQNGKQTVKAAERHKADQPKSGCTICVFNEATARHLLKEIIEVLSYLESVDVVHKDIKPDNIMLSGYFPSDAIRKIIMPPIAHVKRYDDDIPSSYYMSEEDIDTPTGQDDNMSVGSTESDVDEFLWCNASIDTQLAHPHGIGQQRAEFQKNSVEDVHIKLIDFNTSVRTSGPDHRVWDSEGTRLFTPPECFMADRGGGVKGFPRDIWSLGCFLYCMVYGRTPFWASAPIEAIHQIQCSQLVLPENVDVSEDFVDLLKRILEKDPQKRSTLEDIKKHPWLKQADH